MIPRVIRPLVQALYDNRDYRFWACQLCGWSGYFLATFLSITVVDNNVTWPHLGHLALSVLLGILTSWPLRPLYRQTFESNILLRVLIAVLAVVALSLVWTVLRVVIFAWIVGEPAIWDEMNYWFFGSLFVFLSWTVLYYGIKYYELLILEHQKLMEESALAEREKIRRMQAEAAARDAQLQMLRYQLNPHFLFNTMNAINSLVKLKDNDKAQEMIQRLCHFLRHSLEQDCVANVTLEEELQSLMLYLDIEKTRFQDRLSLDFDIAPRARQARVPGLILQPIVENSMKYAIAANEEGGCVRIAADVVADELQLEVSDTGPGMDSKDAGSARGVGLRNTLERLGTLYQDRFSFETINRAPAGLSVRIRFPYHLECGPAGPGR